ncbi:MAG: peptidylprolyl isomerase [Paludibacteraceae bacterium]|nr:peptidylprolyl isomerase [Paludibacteraceae bacterium]MBP7218842.1 peptidylprolyl isomerase [Paludibacteraceae bacterium]MBP8627300.1 peptidylprolyl isomerase [Paludibacteraceae bacterium]MBP8781180.1 peptidylprolyl isomerase [Paludibacteraceae bacterium]MBP9647750.1 peptidylprolyl isomerase [Paludibacteraceae bacterium]
MLKKITLLFVVCIFSIGVFSQNYIVDQVVWIVGDEAILQSEIETEILRLKYEKQKTPESPECVIAEQLALQKLFLAQAKIDSITISEATINQQVESRISYFTEQLGSKEKVEAYFKKPLSKMREELKAMLQDQLMVQEMQQKITKDIKITPSEVTAFYENIPKDSLPIIPEQVEIQLITLSPTISVAEVERVKSKLREFRERIETGDIQFSTLAILYSEDRVSALQGGEIGFRSRSMLVPEYANTAFSLTDPQKVSRIVETEYGFHIIQLIAKQDDQVNSRHILMRPKISLEDKNLASQRLDSIAQAIRTGSINFEKGVEIYSDKSSTKNSNGLLINTKDGSTRFQYDELPQEIINQVSFLNIGEISKPFSFTNENGKEIVAIVKIHDKIKAHKASISDDYQTLKMVYTNVKNTQAIQQWIESKIATTYNQLTPAYRTCNFSYPHWLKNRE